MKDTKKLIDVLPTIFGLIAVSGFVIASSHLSIALGLWMLFGGATFALFTALFSVAFAALKHKFGWMHKVNVGWALLVLSFIAIQIYSWSTVKWTF